MRISFFRGIVKAGQPLPPARPISSRSYTGPLPFRKGEKEGRADINLALGPDASTVALNDPPHVSEADAGAFELSCRMQALEHAEEFVGILHVEAYAIVADEERGFVVRLGGADLDSGPLALAGVFQGIGKQIDDGLAKHERITLDNRQAADLPVNIASFDFAV